MNEKDEELMKGCIELARQGIDLEEIKNGLDPILDKLIKWIKLAIKNYNFIKGLK